MPLSKSFILPNTSISVGYWVAQRGDIDRIVGTVWIQMNGYDSKASYQAGASPLMQKSYTVPINLSATLPVNGDNLLFDQVIAYMEAQVLAQPDFTGASIVA